MGAKLNWTQDTCWMKSNDRFLRWGSALCRVKQVVSGVPTGLWVPPTFWPFLPSQWNPQRAEAMGWWSPGLVVQVASLPLIPWPHRPFLSICKGGGKVRVWPRPCLCLKPLPFLLSLLLPLSHPNYWMLLHFPPKPSPWVTPRSLSSWGLRKPSFSASIWYPVNPLSPLTVNTNAS